MSELGELAPSRVETVAVDDTGEHMLTRGNHRAIRHPGVANELRIPLVAFRAKIALLDEGAALD